MSAKNDVYKAIIAGNPNWKELQAKHFSLQLKGRGSRTLIRFKNTEGWITPSDFAVNYKQAFSKRVNDLVLAASLVFPPEDILQMMPNSIVDHAIEAKLLANDETVQRHISLADQAARWEQVAREEHAENCRTKAKLQVLTDKYNSLVRDYQSLQRLDVQNRQRVKDLNVELSKTLVNKQKIREIFNL